MYLILCNHRGRRELILHKTAALAKRQCQENGNRRKESSIHCWGIICTKILYTENFIPAMYGPFPSSIYIPYIIDGRDEDK